MNETVSSKLIPYLAMVRSAFLGMLAYRLRYLTGIISYTLFISVNYFIWKAIFSTYPDGSRIHGFSLGEMVTYLGVGWIARSCYFSEIDDTIDDLVVTGQISVYLLRPMDFHLTMLCQAAGESLFRILFFTFPVSIVILLFFPLTGPASILYGLLFLVSSVTSFFVLAELNFVVGLMAFELQSVTGLKRAKYQLLQLFSGLLMPIAFFPEWFQSIIYALPFRLMTSVPMELYLGKIALSSVPWIFLQQGVWIAVLWLTSVLLWRREVKRLVLQGG